jgi:hypothetical protein
MPVSIKTAANYFCRDSFSWWDPDTDTFQGSFLGRVRRIDDFVSLWHRSSRRQHFYIRPDAIYTDTGVFIHNNTGQIWLISQTQQFDDWQSAGIYTKMLRAHSLEAPSGVKAEFYPVTTAGSGNNLGPVTVGPAQLVYADLELRTVTKPDDSVEIVTGEYLLAYSRNVTVNDGDFFKHSGSWYRVLEPYGDSGFSYCRAEDLDPAFVTATFTLSDTAAFNPVTGAFSTGTATTRQVSVIVGGSKTTGRPSDRDLAEELTLYIYLRHIGFEPEVGMKLTLNSKPYRVISVNKHYENTQYELVVAP